MQPIVSIITPTYNHEKYIIACIKSVQNQTFKHWEMIIVNDGSTDKTQVLIEDYIKNDPRIRLFNQENIGVFRLGESYNFALSKSVGKYISILEGDDLWEIDKLERQVAIFNENQNVILSWGQAQSINGDTEEVYNLHPIIDKPDYFNNTPVGNILNLLYCENCLPALTITIRKDALVQVGGFLQKHNLPLVDLPTIMELSLLGEFHFDKHIYGKWRIYANQVTKTFTIEIIKGRYETAKEHILKHPEVINKQLSLTSKEFHTYFNNRIMTGYAMSGRYKLIRKEYKNARKDYYKSLFYKGFINPVWRLRALVGVLFSFLHWDIESLAKLLGKKSYSR
jgi:glycosyltransferase involved in cell wall biosynthesis